MEKVHVFLRLLYTTSMVDLGLNKIRPRESGSHLESVASKAYVAAFCNHLDFD